MISDNVAGKVLQECVDVMKLPLTLKRLLLQRQQRLSIPTAATVAAAFIAVRYQECQQDYIFDVVDTTCYVTKKYLSAWSLSYYYHLYAEGEEVIPRVRTTHITVHNNNKDGTYNNKKKLLLSTDPSTELLIIEARSDSTNRP